MICICGIRHSRGEKRVANCVGSPNTLTTECTALKECFEHRENLLKISVNSVFSVVRKYLAHSFSYS